MFIIKFANNNLPNFKIDISYSNSTQIISFGLNWVFLFFMMIFW